MKRELLLGAGLSRTKRMRFPGSENLEFESPFTLDISEPADIVHDLNNWKLRFFDDGEFDEIHAYEVLEHVGRQGDVGFFFNQFSEFYRILKPGGFMCISVPMWDSLWSYGDPGHTRVLPKEVFAFLNPAHYDQCGREDSSAADYRHLLGDTHFEVLGVEESEHQLAIILERK